MARAAAQARPARSRLSRLAARPDARADAHHLLHFTLDHLSQRSHAMPTFHIELFEGRTLEQKRQFVEAITQATCESLGVEPNSVDIILTEVKRENWATGGRLWSETEA
ncbi:4-oxalocrotonate tautomerase [Burkholderia sp. Ax-1724]|uniref:4-oxalocrotonate tautomerase n=1 Tax=Burkholderia sp. Ax-1724 TaxID=2608336 RepID=UPI0023DA2CA9|nr:4-oxalocrotonate tautomerase [Burkholderia sp. Ax-1724]